MSNEVSWRFTVSHGARPVESLPRGGAAHLQLRSSNANSLCWRVLAQPAGVITPSQLPSSYLSRARISEFESSQPSHAVGLSEQKWSASEASQHPFGETEQRDRSCGSSALASACNEL